MLLEKYDLCRRNWLGEEEIRSRNICCHRNLDKKVLNSQGFGRVSAGQICVLG